ncbi:MAG: AAA family ATPase [Deltaproteobacteria bacterium]|nr:AAA family ATPase [Deltaproteobacteria bacterium]
MILRVLELHNFGRFRERSVAFDAGPTLVLGRNEMGKSTLLECLPAALFGVKKKERFRNWWRGGDCRVAVTFSEGPRHLRIERDILTDHVFLAEEGGDAPSFCFDGKVSPTGRCSEREEYLDRISSWFGVAEEEVFRASLFYGQGSLEIEPRADLEGKVKKLLSGSAEIDYDKVLDSLLEDYFRVTRYSPWGKDKTQERELEKVRNRLSELEQLQRDCRERGIRLEKLRSDIEGLRNSVEEDRREAEKGKRYLGWVRTWLHREEREQRLQEAFRHLQQEIDRVERLHREQRQLEKSLAEFPLPEGFSAVLPRMVSELRELRSKSRVLQEEINRVYARLPAGFGAPWGGVFLLAFLVAGAGFFFLQRRPELLAPVGLAAGLGISLLFLCQLKKSGRVSAQRHLIKGQAQVLEENLEQARRRLVEIEGLLERHDLKHGEEDLKGLQGLLARQAGLQQRLREIHGALEVLDESEVLEAEKAVLTRELAVVREQRQQSAPERAKLLKAEELPEAEEKLARLEKRLALRERELAELLREESFLAAELGDLRQLEEETLFLQERERLLLERKEVLAKAFELLGGAVEDFRSGSLKRFAAEVAGLVAVVTGGRYRELRMEEGFRFLLREPEGGWQLLQGFSRGTVDAVFFSIRLALTRQLAGGRPLPLLLDDPMVNFDSQRLADTLKYLENLGSDFQVVLCSHNQGFLDLIDRSRWQVLNLDGR